MSICFESFTKLLQRCRKKRKTSCFCLLKMLYFNCSLPFLSSLPPRLTSPLCIFIMAVTWRKGRIACPHTRWSSSSSSSLSILLITCNWSFLRYHYCNYLEEIDEKKFLDNFTQLNYYSVFLTKNIALYHSDICYSSLLIVGTLMKSISLHNCSVAFISATVSLNGLAWSFSRETHHPFPPS